MKQIIFILCVTVILVCSHQHKKAEFIGIWDLVSVTDIKTGEVEFPEDDDKEFVQVNSDSIYLSWDDTYSWTIVGDSILIDGLISVYIKELNANELVVEYEFFGGQRVNLIKRD